MCVDVLLPKVCGCICESRAGKSSVVAAAAATAAGGGGGAAAAACVARCTAMRLCHRCRRAPETALTSRLRGISRCYRVLERKKGGKESNAAESWPNPGCEKYRGPQPPINFVQLCGYLTKLGLFMDVQLAIFLFKSHLPTPLYTVQLESM